MLMLCALRRPRGWLQVEESHVQRALAALEASVAALSIMTLPDLPQQGALLPPPHVSNISPGLDPLPSATELQPCT